MSNKLLKSILTMVVLTVAVITIVGGGAASEIDGQVSSSVDTAEIMNSGISVIVSPEPIERNDVESVNSGILTLSLDYNLPEKFDLRDVSGKNYVTSIRDQAPYNSCWAFSLLGALESNILMNGYTTEDNLDLSESQLIYFAGNRDGVTKDTALIPEFLPLLDTYFGNKDIWEWKGNFFSVDYAERQLASGIGAATEENPKLKYSYLPTILDNHEVLNKNLAVAENAYYLTDYIMISEKDRDEIKKMLMQNGAASVGIYISNIYNQVQGYIDDEGNLKVTKWCPETIYTKDNLHANHGVVLVGWDDTYPKENFAQYEVTAIDEKTGKISYNVLSQPTTDGAWLIKNSYGTYNGWDGYNWVSYEDVSISNITFMGSTPANSFYDTIYQYDGGFSTENKQNPGKPIVGQTEEIATKSVFTANGNEKITAVRFGTENTNVDYNISILVNGKEICSKSGKERYTGDHTLFLYANDFISDSSGNLSKGDKVEVVVRLSKMYDGENKRLSVPIDAETIIYSTSTGEINKKFVTNTDIHGKSFIQYQGSNDWVDIVDLPEKTEVDKEKGETVVYKFGSARIKLYTENREDVVIPQHRSSVVSFTGTKSENDFTFNAMVITKATLPGATKATIINKSSSKWYTFDLVTDGFIGPGTLYFQVPLDVISIKGKTVNDVSLLGSTTRYLSTENGYAKYSATVNSDGSYAIDFENNAVSTAPITEPEIKEIDENHPETKVNNAILNIIGNSSVDTGKILALKATMSDGSTVDVDWTSSNATVATVDENGNVKAEKEGTATITATNKLTGKTATKTITVDNVAASETSSQPTKTPFPVLGILAGLGIAGILVMRRK